jgi:type II secretory pathway pseudopilin PulG
MAYMAPATTYTILATRPDIRTGARRMRARFGKGVTLIEMLVVVGVIILLAGFVVSLTRHVDNQAKEKALGNVVALLKSALQEYHESEDAFPIQAYAGDPNQGEVATHAEYLYGQLDSVPESRRLLQQIPASLVVGIKDSADPMRVCDPWGTVIDYRYKADDTFPELVSAGPDKTFGTPDDISSRNM